MRKGFVTLLIATVLSAAHVAYAQEMRPDDLTASAGLCQGSLNAIGCLGNASTNQAPTTVTGAVRSTSTNASQSSIKYAPYEKVVANGGPNGEDCITTGYQELATDGDPVVASAAVSAVGRRDFGGSILAAYPPCPAQSGPSGETPQSVAVSYWQNIPLPKPSPHIQPGRAITGKYAYLETHGSTSHTFDQPDTPFGALHIVATGNYFVDWGDGTNTGPHSDEGAPWPDGRITHEYINVGAYDVVVTERWTATWQFGADSGFLGQLTTTGRIDDFPVQEVQVVRYR